MDALPTFTPAITAGASAGSSSGGSRGPNARWEPRSKRGRNYLLRKEYRETNLLELLADGEAGALARLADIRWGVYGENKQVCPACGTIDTHYWCPSISRWKCRSKSCGKQFTIFSGTRVHNMRMGAAKFLSIMYHFAEAKDSISAREQSGLHGLEHQTVHVLLLKVREALRETMLAEPLLDGYVQADAAYFMKYVRPKNVGTGAAFGAKADQKNAGLNEDSKTKQTVSPKMHALVVFVQTGAMGERRYKVAVVKTENQVDLLALGQAFCTPTALPVTDQHSGYNFFSGEFDQHFRVNHSEEFMDKDGFHTNYAEGFFSRLRAAVGGAWHKTTLPYLEEYGWEFAWRQTVAGRTNLEQLNDLLDRVLNSGRAQRFGDYWGKREGPSQRPTVSEGGSAMEVDKAGIKKKRGRPLQGTVKMRPPEAPKRSYQRRSTPGA